MRAKAKLVGAIALLALLLSACRDSLPQSSLNPAGPVSDTEAGLFTLVFWIAVAVFVIVEGLLLVFLIKYRHRPGNEPSQVHGNTRLEIGWTILPSLLLAVLAVPTVSTIWELARKPTGNVVHVNVVGHQWWWEFEYPDQKITTANELHIPVGVPVYAKLCAFGASGEAGPTKTTANGTPAVGKGPPMGKPCVDTPVSIGSAVIHSFWVPRLAGKEDVVPGRTNTLTFEAEEPGVYEGQCAEFCGWSHAFMRFRVVAQTQEDFDAWVRGQQQDAAAPAAGSLAEKGAQTFGALPGGAGAGCVACHSISGTEAAGLGGPDLTHFASRNCFAGCTLRRTGPNIERWLRDPAAVKPGSFMPNYHLKPDEIEALVAYLESLK